MPTYEIVIPIAFETNDNPSTWQGASKVRDAVEKAIKGRLRRSVKGLKLEPVEYRETGEEKNLERGRELIRRDYYADVHAVAEDFKRAAKAGEFTDTDGADEWLHQTVDDSQRVIYTHKAKEALLVSDNEDAYADDFGDDLVQDGQIRWSVLAFCAFQADILERLRADGIELSDASTWSPQEAEKPEEATA